MCSLARTLYGLRALTAPPPMRTSRRGRCLQGRLRSCRPRRPRPHRRQGKHVVPTRPWRKRTSLWSSVTVGRWVSGVAPIGDGQSADDQRQPGVQPVTPAGTWSRRPWSAASSTSLRTCRSLRSKATSVPASRTIAPGLVGPTRPPRGSPARSRLASRRAGWPSPHVE